LVYRPDQSSASPGGTNSRDSSFALKPGIVVIGGFAGTEPGTPAGLEMRRPSVNRTTLTGEIGNTETRGDNCYHVVTAQSTTSPYVLVDDTARLDGFWVVAGNANGTGANQDWGGGIFVAAAQPLVQNCVFTDNDAIAGGGGHSEGLCGNLGDPPTLTTHPEFRSGRPVRDDRPSSSSSPSEDHFAVSTRSLAGQMLTRRSSGRPVSSSVAVCPVASKPSGSSSFTTPGGSPSS
jgi:hypothetical protein